MPSRFFNYSLVEKDLFCTNIYEKHIFETYQMISSFERSAKLLDSALPTGCYTNFRDALFHFRKMVRSSEGTEIENQAFAIKEHCGRAQTDAATAVLTECTEIINRMLGNPDYVIENRKELEDLYHSLNQKILNKRIGGMMIDEFGITGIFACSMAEICDSLDALFIFIRENAKEAFSSVIIQRRKEYQENEKRVKLS